LSAIVSSREDFGCASNVAGPQRIVVAAIMARVVRNKVSNADNVIANDRQALTRDPE
jgi:hypothetical protein